ncbi:DeoR/GlpR family DNA-binding transcription regulator [Rubrimonas sp.]|uniref:DeoR/GlpR family DNA-binding transcription regulator n=1 Tax=Rubrimonas sp. TaxID=2036015 RepID=UPI002FDF03AC
MRPSAAARRDRIALELSQQGYVSGCALAEMFGVSEMTIRRDLDALAEQGKLRRSHGGAVGLGAGRLDMVEPDMAERIRRNSAGKARIGAYAATTLTRGAFVALDIGSTTLCLAHALIGQNVRFLTCSLKIAALLGAAGETVVTPGGAVQGSEPSLVGAMTRRHIETFHFDVVFIGASGVAATGLFDYSLDDAEIKRALIERAARVVALLDSSKFERLSVAKVCPLAALDALITDAPPPQPLADALADAGVHVTLATEEMA